MQMRARLAQFRARYPKVNPGYDAGDYTGLKDYAERAKWGPFEGRRPLEEDEK